MAIETAGTDFPVQHWDAAMNAPNWVVRNKSWLRLKPGYYGHARIIFYTEAISDVANPSGPLATETVSWCWDDNGRKHILASDSKRYDNKSDTFNVAAIWLDPDKHVDMQQTTTWIELRFDYTPSVGQNLELIPAITEESAGLYMARLQFGRTGSRGEAYGWVLASKDKAAVESFRWKRDS